MINENSDIIINIIYGVITLIGIIIFMICYIKKEKREKIVLTTSGKIKKLNDLNNQCNFKSYYKKNRTIYYNVNSKRNFEQTNATNVLEYHMLNNIDDITDDVEDLIYNKKLYEEYIDECDLIRFMPEQTLEEEWNIKNAEYIKIENKFFKKYMIKDEFDLDIRLIIRYRSPKGRNFYEKKVKLVSTDIISIYNSLAKKEQHKQTAEYERSRMSASLRYDVLNRDKFRCQICGATQEDGVKLHVDHIKPVSKGGKTEMSNLRTLCDRCNLGKSDKE